MTASSITTKVAAVLLSGAVESAGTLFRAGERLHAKLDTRSRVAGVLWKLCARITSSGEAIEALADRAAVWLGVDMVADVLEPMVARAYRA
jgi:hypothetical protein